MKKSGEGKVLQVKQRDGINEGKTCELNAAMGSSMTRRFTLGLSTELGEELRGVVSRPAVAEVGPEAGVSSNRCQSTFGRQKS